jgi:gamma-glutamyltranspeptidase
MISGIVDHGLDAQQLADAPRIVNENRIAGASVSDTRIEPAPYAMPASLLDELRARGQTVLPNALPFGSAHLISADPATGRLRRGVDPRGDFEF